MTIMLERPYKNFLANQVLKSDKENSERVRKGPHPDPAFGGTIWAQPSLFDDPDN
jgi:hypothetical protein